MLYPYLPICLFFLFGCTSSQLMSQDLSQYRWQNRLIVLQLAPEGEDLFQQQLQLLGEDVDGLRERKLIVIQISESESRIHLPKPQPLEVKEKDQKRFRSSEEPFTFILMGLDGGVKLRRNELVSREYLYALIDGMPMRRAEMSKKKNNQP